MLFQWKNGASFRLKKNRPILADKIIIATMLFVGAAQAQSLPNFGADPSSATVSGISSGGYQAVQAHVAYSATFKGAAIFAGGPYYCAEGDLSTGLNRCMNAVGAIPVTKLANQTKSWASTGEIDAVENLKFSQVYIFQGSKDTTVKPPVGGALNDYYRRFVTTANVQFVKNVPAEHAWITWKKGAPINACGVKQSPYVNNCDSDLEKVFLEKFYGPLNPKAANLTGKLLSFDQNEFFDDKNAAAHSMGQTGYVYVPAACETAGSNCRAHLALHGCQQYYGKIGDAFIKNAGINEWADNNKIIVLYPQTTFDDAKGNPNGCWDWWGYDDKYGYAKKSAPQLLALKRMVDRVVGVTVPPPVPPVQCFTDANYYHVVAGRAHVSGWAFTRANGSNDPMGYYNVFDVTTLKQTGPNYYEVGGCQ